MIRVCVVRLYLSCTVERTDIGEGTRFLLVSIRQHLLYLTRYLWETDNLKKLFLILVSSITNYGHVIGNRRNKDHLTGEEFLVRYHSLTLV